MAVIASWAGAGLADATAVGTSTVGTGDTAFTTVTSGAFQVDTTGLHSPRIQMDQAAATAAELIWDSTVVGTSLTAWAARVYVELSAWPPSNGGRVLSAYTASNTLLWFCDLTTAGLLRLRNAGGSAVSTSASALPASTELRIEAVHNNGNVTVNVYTGDGTTVFTSVSSTGLGTGSGLEAVRFGMPATSPVWARLWLDEMAVANTAAEIGPVVTPPVTGTGSITATASLSGAGKKATSGAGTCAATGAMSAAGTKAARGTGTIAAAAALASTTAPHVVTAPAVPVFLPGVPVGTVPAEFNAKIRDPFTALLSPPTFRARRTSALTVAEGTVQALPWNTPDEDTYSGWASGAPTKYVVPDGWSGWWFCTAAVSLFGTGASGLVVIPSIAVNSGAPGLGVTYEGQEVFVPTSTSAVPKIAASSWWVYAAAGDFIELQLWYSTESAITAVDTTAGFECRLELTWDGV
jgi:hypothetical protein